LPAPAAAQNITAPPPPIPDGITVEEIKVHGASLEGNLEGNDVDRQVMVVLPPSYKTSPNKRYPVVYYLHGFAIDGKNFYNFMHVPEAVAHNAARGNEFIVVVPSTLTRMGGSMYSSSVTTGDFRKFIAEDLVRYVDSHYRTIATRGGRGLAGHSMGGYGTWTIGMSYPQVFDSIWRRAPAASVRAPRRSNPRLPWPPCPMPASTSRASACAPGSPRPSPGRPIRRTRRSTSISRSRTARSIRW
jgi:enterochelin esterase-like enzyme